MYDGRLGRNLIDCVNELLKNDFLCLIRRISKTHLKHVGHMHGYEFLPACMVTSEY